MALPTRNTRDAQLSGVPGERGDRPETMQRSSAGCIPGSLRIVHVASGDLWGGAEAQVALLAPALSRRGHHVVVVTFNRGRLEQVLLAAGLAARVEDESRGSFRLWTGVRHFFRAFQPHVVHAHGYKEGIIGLGASLGLPIARVRTIHGVPELPARKGGAAMRVYDALDRGICRVSSAYLIAVSRELASATRRWAGNRVRYVENSVAIDVTARPRDSVRAELGLAGSVLLYAGRLEPVKGPDVLLEAFAEIRVALPDATLVVAGEGSLASELRARVAERPLPGVRFLGQRNDIPDLIAAADLVVLPSRGEGMPTLLLEALLAGRAVVATRVGAVADVTEDGRFARIVPPGDAATLARACIALLRDSAARQRLAEGAPAAVRRRFDPALAAAATEALYLEALGALRQGPGQKRSHEPPSP